MSNEKKPKKKSAAPPKEHKPSWQERQATVQDIKAFLDERVMLRHNVVGLTDPNCSRKYVPPGYKLGNGPSVPLQFRPSANFPSLLKVFSLLRVHYLCLALWRKESHSSISLITSYTARHTWASLAYQQGVPLAVISKSLGHSSPVTTEAYLKEIDDSFADASGSMCWKNILQ